MSPALRAKMLAEFIGTFALIFTGPGPSAERAKIAICASRRRDFTLTSNDRSSS